MGHFVLSPREREKRDRRDSSGDEREGQGRKRNRNESEETEEIKTFPLYPYLLQGLQALPNCKPISVEHPGDVRYTTPSPHQSPPTKDNNAKSKKGRVIILVQDMSSHPILHFYQIPLKYSKGNLSYKAT